MVIYACPRCGSQEIFMGTMDSGVIIGLTSIKNVCKDCGFQGAHLQFESEKEYLEFVKTLKKDKDQKQPVDEEEQNEKITLSKKDQQVLDFVDDVKNIREEQYEDVKVEKPKNWWPEIIISIIVSIIVGIFSYFSLVETMGNTITTFYLIGYTFIIFIGLLVIIVVIEYVLKSIKHSII
ncbi:hypothetical protein B6U98_03685 [Thermoplasmatales archaeon ex4572_165]|nr:MAG: hypothetical protein B6U98_03685 [Thermoplasmatales archaeon ex4572_165]